MILNYGFKDSPQKLDKDTISFIPIILLAYIIDTLNIIISIQLFLSGEISYSITFWVIFSIDKLILIICSIVFSSKRILTFLIADLLHLGWLQVLLINTIGDMCLFAIMFRISISRGLIQNFIQLLFYFGLSSLENGNLSDNYKYLAYFTFLLQILFTSILLSTFSIEYNIKEKVYKLARTFLSVLTYLITISSLLSISDIYGVKLIYYNFIILTIQSVYLKQIFSKYQQRFDGFALITNAIYNNNIINLQSDYMSKHTTIINYLSQVGRFILFMAVAGKQITIDLNHLSDTNKIYQINNLITFFLNLIYFTFFFQFIINKFLANKIFVLSSYQNIYELNDYLSKQMSPFVKKIEIIYEYQKFEVTIHASQDPDTVCQNKQCQEYFKMLSLIDKLSQDKKIESSFINYCYLQCYYNLKLYFIGQAEVNKSKMTAFKNFSETNQIINIIQQRFEKGYIINQTNSFLFESINYYEKQIFIKFQSQFLSMMQLDRIFKSYSMNSLPMIKYDLLDF